MQHRWTQAERELSAWLAAVFVTAATITAGLHYTQHQDKAGARYGRAVGRTAISVTCYAMVKHQPVSDRRNAIARHWATVCFGANRTPRLRVFLCWPPGHRPAYARRTYVLTPRPKTEQYWMGTESSEAECAGDCWVWP
jgi:hypothetical protein